MKYNFSSGIVSLLILINLMSTPSSADVLYRETFSFCGNATASHDALDVSQWSALAAGRNLGKIGFLKVSSVGSPNLENAVASNPSGPYEGNALWIKEISSDNKSGLLMFTEEFALSTSDLSAVSFEQRAALSYRDESQQMLIGGAKIALRINSVWYISDQIFSPSVKNEWQMFQTSLSFLTFGTSPYYPGVGPKNPQDSGKKLPANSRITSFGLFYPFVNSRIRIDNFALYNSASTGISNAVNTNSLTCVPAKPNGPADSNGSSSSIGSNSSNGSAESSTSAIPGGSTAANGSVDVAYDPNRICVSGFDSRFIKMQKLFKSKMYPSENSSRLGYLRNKIALNLATDYKLTLTQITRLSVGDFNQMTNGKFVVKQFDSTLVKLTLSDTKLIQRFIRLGKIGSDLTGPLLRPTLSKNRLAKVGICNSALRKSLEARAAELRLAKYLKFIAKAL